MKNKYINFRVTEKEKIEIGKLATKAKLSQTDFGQFRKPRVLDIRRDFFVRFVEIFL